MTNAAMWPLIIFIYLFFISVDLGEISSLWSNVALHWVCSPKQPKCPAWTFQAALGKVPLEQSSTCCIALHQPWAGVSTCQQTAKAAFLLPSSSAGCT